MALETKTTRDCSLSALWSSRAAMPSSDSVSRSRQVWLRFDVPPNRRRTWAGIAGTEPITDNPRPWTTSETAFTRRDCTSHNTMPNSGTQKPNSDAMAITANRSEPLYSFLGVSAICQ